MIPLCKPEVNEEMKQATIQAMENEHFVLGESVYKFEEEFAHYIGTKYAISVNSGSAALELTLAALGLKPGDKVITTPNSFVASANCIVFNGGIPVFSDISEEDGNLDPMKIRVKDEKGILPVHIYGNPCDLDPILELAESKNIFIVEDACQAHGAEYEGKKVGSFGIAGCFSFYSTKNMTVGGDGGMVTTNDETIRDKVMKMRDCGRKTKYEHDELGSTRRLNTINAAIGRVQLKYLDSWNEKRIENAKLYSKLLPGEIQLEPNKKSKAVFHLYVIKVKNRDELIAHLDANGIKSLVHYPIPIHKQPLYTNRLNYNVSMPVAERFAKIIVSLPMFPSLTHDEIKFISENVNEVLD